MQTPDTRPSLILRLRNHNDIQAWNDFAAIYEPLVYRLARQMTLQHADALEAKQEVMLHLTKVVDSWDQQPGGSFRGWLYRVARNVMIRMLERQRRDMRGTGDSRFLQQLAELPSPSNDGSAEFDLEFKRQVFLNAAAKIKADVEVSTWQAFWQTAIENRSVQDVATALGISHGNVYVARCRVMKRLREHVERDLKQGWDPVAVSAKEASS